MRVWHFLTDWEFGKSPKLTREGNALALPFPSQRRERMQRSCLVSHNSLLACFFVTSLKEILHLRPIWPTRPGAVLLILCS